MPKDSTSTIKNHYNIPQLRGHLSRIMAFKPAKQRGGMEVGRELELEVGSVELSPSITFRREDDEYSQIMRHPCPDQESPGTMTLNGKSCRCAGMVSFISSLLTLLNFNYCWTQLLDCVK